MPGERAAVHAQGPGAPATDLGARRRRGEDQQLSVPGMRSQLTRHGRELVLSVPPAALLNADNVSQAGFTVAWNGAPGAHSSSRQCSASSTLSKAAQAP